MKVVLPKNGRWIIIVQDNKTGQDYIYLKESRKYAYDEGGGYNYNLKEISNRESSVIDFDGHWGIMEKLLYDNSFFIGEADQAIDEIRKGIKLYSSEWGKGVLKRKEFEQVKHELKDVTIIKYQIEYSISCDYAIRISDEKREEKAKENNNGKNC